MLAGFLAAMRALAPAASFTCCVPFALPPLARRFPEIHWLPYDDPSRATAIVACDLWLGLGGSPFQCKLSRWFIDHLIGEAARCARLRKPMYYLGVGVQNTDELAVPDVQRVCRQAVAIWTRDAASAERLAAAAPGPRIAVAADLAHIFFQDTPPPPAAAGRIALVANFDYGAWPGQAACLRAAEAHASHDCVWLAQESRELPGAERVLFASLPAVAQARWRLVSPERPGAPLPEILADWPSAEWLITARYHAALAGAWAGSRMIVLGTNEKLHAAARDVGATVLSPSADEVTVRRALEDAPRCAQPAVLAEQARSACAAFVDSAS